MVNILNKLYIVRFAMIGIKIRMIFLYFLFIKIMVIIGMKIGGFIE